MARVPQEGHAALDADTILSPRSGKAALRAVGAVTSAVDAVMRGEAQQCLLRHPAARTSCGARPRHGLLPVQFHRRGGAPCPGRARHPRVAIVDFDVHHGNGTQAVAEQDPSLFFASSHQYPLYPGTGAAEETGVGNIVNVPLRPGTEGGCFRRAFEARILPALDAFAPELLLVSAGFDAHRADPLAGLELEDEDFGWVTARLAEAAGRHAQGRLVSVLEGGYDLKALAGSAAAHVCALMKAD